MVPQQLSGARELSLAWEDNRIEIAPGLIKIIVTHFMPLVPCFQRLIATRIMAVPLPIVGDGPESAFP